MVRNPVVTALLLLLAIAALTNPIWLFPAEGETRYTYTRVPVTVAEGRVTHQVPGADPAPRLNDVEGIGCDYSDDSTLTRGCAFDQYLVEHGPVSVSRAGEYTRGEPFVVLNGSYYARTVTERTTETTLDVERVSAETVLHRLARDATAGSLVEQDGPVRSTTPPQDHTLGQVYRARGGYYTVVFLGAAPLDRPLVSPFTRLLLGLVGVGLLALAGLRVRASRRQGTVESL